MLSGTEIAMKALLTDINKESTKATSNCERVCVYRHVL